MQRILLQTGFLSAGLYLACLSQSYGQVLASTKDPITHAVRNRQPLVWRITGRVTSERGEPIPGVNVTARGTTSGTTTAADGTYTLNVPEQAGTLVFSSVGYTAREMTYSTATVVNVTLTEDVRALSEVVVTGYTTEQKKDIVGSVAIVNTKDLTTTPTGNVTSQLQGRSPGVAVSSDGGLGGGAKVRIRGFGSFGGSDPLYIVDGVQTGVTNINPDDIESLQVLKDAAAASIYGARAANGVVIITTRQGRPGPAKISVSSYYGINYYSKNNFPDVLNVKDFGDLYWKEIAGAYATSGGNAQYQIGSPNFVGHLAYGKGATPVVPEYILAVNNGTKYGGSDLEALKTSNLPLFNSLVDPANYNFQTHQIVKGGETNWFKEVAVAAPIQNYNINATGGSAAGTYALSLGVINQRSTTAKTASYARYTLRANTSFKLRKNIRIGENANLFYTTRPGADGSFANAWTMQSIIPVYDIMGNPAGSNAPGLVVTGDHGRNPVTDAWRGRFNKSATYGIIGNVYGEIDIFKGLTARTSFGIDYFATSSLSLTQVTYEHVENTTISGQLLTSSANNGNNYTWTNTLNYGTSFGKHSLKFLLGTEALKNYTENLSATRQSASNTVPAYAIEDDPNFLTINAGVGNQSNSGSFNRNTLYSIFGRVDYSFGDKYLFNATLRRDQSSKFAATTRTGYFPAAAVGWRVSSENFMKNLNWVSDLKLRASYGIIGNQNGLDNFNQYNVYVNDLGQSYPTNGTSANTSFTTNRIGNPNAKWEQNTTTNLGIDASLFNRSLDITFEVYNKRTTGLLVGNQPAFTSPTGNSSPNQPSINAGDMRNRGIDLGITKRGNLADGLRYEANLTFTRYKNQVTKVLDNPLSFLTGGSLRFSTPVSRTQVGLPIAMFYGYKIDGFFNTQEEVDAYNKTVNPTGTTTPWIPPAVGRWRIKDVNGDNKIDDNDRTVIGNPHPDFQMGLNLTLNYKNFDFTGFLFWNQGGQLFNYSRYWVDFNTFQVNRTYRMLNDSWTPDHMNAKLPVLDLLDTYSNKNVTDYFLEDATYLRVKTMQLGYNFPKTILNKIGMDRLRVYVQAQNLFTFKHKNTSVMDPGNSLAGGDTSMGIIDGGSPTPKQVLVGLNFGF